MQLLLHNLPITDEQNYFHTVTKIPRPYLTTQPVNSPLGKAHVCVLGRILFSCGAELRRAKEVWRSQQRFTAKHRECSANFI